MVYTENPSHAPNWHYNKKVSMYTKWFNWILNEFISCSEQGLVKK
jgi:hypothetical protein